MLCIRNKTQYLILLCLAFLYDLRRESSKWTIVGSGGKEEYICRSCKKNAGGVLILSLPCLKTKARTYIAFFCRNNIQGSTAKTEKQLWSATKLKCMWTHKQKKAHHGS